MNSESCYFYNKHYHQEKNIIIFTIKTRAILGMQSIAKYDHISLYFTISLKAKFHEKI